jgi:hypothetical protein
VGLSSHIDLPKANFDITSSDLPVLHMYVHGYVKLTGLSHDIDVVLKVTSFNEQLRTLMVFYFRLFGNLYHTVVPFPDFCRYRTFSIRFF